MSAHIKLMCYIVEGIIIKFLPIDRIMHLTPTSSLCWQSCSPSPLCSQFISCASFPMHATRSSTMGPVPWPNMAKGKSIAPVCIIENKSMTVLWYKAKLCWNIHENQHVHYDVTGTKTCKYITCLCQKTPIVYIRLSHLQFQIHCHRLCPRCYCNKTPLVLRWNYHPPPVEGPPVFDKQLHVYMAHY